MLLDSIVFGLRFARGAIQSSQIFNSSLRMQAKIIMKQYFRKRGYPKINDNNCPIFSIVQIKL